MGDGVTLCSDVYRPDPSGKFPVTTMRSRELLSASSHLMFGSDPLSEFVCYSDDARCAELLYAIY
jgi:predicted acyl esterase